MVTPKIFYEDLLDGFELRERIDKELEFEQDYLNHVRKLLAVAQVDADVDADYSRPFSFSGGKVSPEVVLSALLDQVQDCVGIKRPVHCGLWPSGELGARTRRHGDTAIILVDVGLWFYLRFACQQVTLALEAITARPEQWGPDDASKDPGGLLRDYLHRYISGESNLRDSTRLTLLAGPRETLRRDLNRAALLYVVAHEYSHAISSDAELKTVVWSERNELASQAVENNADQLAANVLGATTFTSGPLAAVLGPVLTLCLQAFALRTQQANGLDPVNWTHLAPEIRAEIVQSMLITKHPMHEAVAIRFREWLWARLQYEELWGQGMEKAT